MDCLECEVEGGLGLEVSGGRGLEERGVGVMSMGVSFLGSWRSSMVFSNLSSFCSTLVEASFSSREATLSPMDWCVEAMFLMLLFVRTMFWCKCSKSLFEVCSLE